MKYQNITLTLIKGEHDTNMIIPFEASFLNTVKIIPYFESAACLPMDFPNEWFFKKILLKIKGKLKVVTFTYHVVGWDGSFPIIDRIYDYEPGKENLENLHIFIES